MFKVRFLAIFSIFVSSPYFLAPGLARSKPPPPPFSLVFFGPFLPLGTQLLSTPGRVVFSPIFFLKLDPFVKGGTF